MVPPDAFPFPLVRLEDCWAKTWPGGPLQGHPALSVRDHCLNVGAVAEALCGITSNEAPAAFLVWLAACHDIGKVSPGFQSKCDGWMRQRGLTGHSPAWQSQQADHSKVSQFSLQHILKERFALTEETAPFGRPSRGCITERPTMAGSGEPVKPALRETLHGRRGGCRWRTS